MPRRADRYDLSAPSLAVYLHGTRVGAIGESGADLWFRYDPAIIEAPDARRWAISVRLPVAPRTYGHDETLAFFDNLLLESDLREAIAKAAKLDESDVAGMLGRLGGECAGAVSVWPIDVEPPTTAEYRAIPRGDLEALFTQKHGARLTALQLEARQAMSGVQHKLSFAWRDHAPWLPLNGAPGSVILKRSTGQYDGLALNEHMCLRLFDAVGLPTAATEVLDGPSGFLKTERFDRPVDVNGQITRLHQEDFCQATGRLPKRKYQFSGGPGFGDLARVLRRYSASPGRDLELLVRAALMQIVVGNMDAHAKNYALLYTHNTAQLAPFYDIVCTEAYEGLDRQLSMNVGHSRDPERLTFADLQRFAKDMELGVSTVQREIDRLVAEVPLAVGALWSAAPAHPVLDVMQRIISARLQRLMHCRN
ncbi:MAG: HipA domain-containing protein [Gemmatimonadaceae bacterium]|nr:HipA domain-containing protein [Gemmatimonadaceae bacterium]